MKFNTIIYTGLTLIGLCAGSFEYGSYITNDTSTKPNSVKRNEEIGKSLDSIVNMVNNDSTYSLSQKTEDAINNLMHERVNLYNKSIKEIQTYNDKLKNQKDKGERYMATGMGSSLITFLGVLGLITYKIKKENLIKSKNDTN